MAIGLGKIFGFRFPENFNYPYISSSATEFWRRWHMSLGAWFRDYLYIPLGGNRVSKLRWMLNLLVVWMATGLWHGADWNFVVWGLWFALLLMIEKLFLLRFLNKTKILGHVYLILSMFISFIIFDMGDMSQVWHTIKAMFGFGDLPFTTTESLYLLRNYGIILAVAIVGATPAVKTLVNKLKHSQKGSAVVCIAEPVVLTL